MVVEVWPAVKFGVNCVNISIINDVILSIIAFFLTFLLPNCLKSVVEYNHLFSVNFNLKKVFLKINGILFCSKLEASFFRQ